MMKIVLAFDSFKGSLTAREVCEIVRDGIQSVRPEFEPVMLPMADGGEGTAEAMMAALGGEWIPLTVSGPLPSMHVEAGFAQADTRAISDHARRAQHIHPVLCSDRR
jgi:glycerate kinase